jgi:hypothetical protein
MAHPVLDGRLMPPLRRRLLFALFGATLFVARGSLRAEQELVVYDNDWNIPATLMHLIPSELRS